MVDVIYKFEIRFLTQGQDKSTENKREGERQREIEREKERQRQTECG